MLAHEALNFEATADARLPVLGGQASPLSIGGWLGRHRL
jgi:hypothetical protein